MLLPVGKGTAAEQFCSEKVEGRRKRKKRFDSWKARKGRKRLAYIHMMVTLCLGQVAVFWDAWDYIPGEGSSFVDETLHSAWCQCHLSLPLLLWQRGEEEAGGNSGDSAIRHSENFLWPHGTWPLGHKGSRLHKMWLKTNTNLWSLLN